MSAILQLNDLGLDGQRELQALGLVEQIGNSDGLAIAPEFLEGASQ